MTKIPERPDGRQWLLLNDFSYQISRKSLKDSVTQLFAAVHNLLATELIEPYKDILPQEIIYSKPKITQGENYDGGAWQVLDYPRIFDKDKVFALRLLCLWGKGFHLTLHLSGDYKLKFMNSLLANADKSLLICTSVNPWIHHVDDKNFAALKDETYPSANFQDQDYFKTGISFPADEWNLIPAHTLRHAQQWFAWMTG